MIKAHAWRKPKETFPSKAHTHSHGETLGFVVDDDS